MRALELAGSRIGCALAAAGGSPAGFPAGGSGERSATVASRLDGDAMEAVTLRPLLSPLSPAPPLLLKPASRIPVGDIRRERGVRSSLLWAASPAAASLLPPSSQP